MEPETDVDADTFVGYRSAGDYLGLKRNTLSSYVTKGTGPAVSGRVIRGQYVLPVFTRDELDRWKSDRPGQGARTDLIQASA